MSRDGALESGGVARASAEPRPWVLAHVTTVPMSLRFLSGQAAFMAERGFRFLAISSAGNDLDWFGRTERVQTIAVRMTRRIAPAADLRALGQLVLSLRRIRPDVVHAHTPKAGLLAMIAAWLVRVPVRIYHVHGLVFETVTGPRRRLLEATERAACRFATRVLSVSPSVSSAMVEAGICPRGKIAVLHNGSSNGIDGVRFSPERWAGERERVRRELGIPPEALVVGFVGRIVRDKGIAELQQAWTALAADTSVHLLLVGMTERLDPLPRDVEQALRSHPRVHMTGLVWETPPLYSAMDVLVLPTHREGFGVVALEAAAMELPVVATRVTGCVDAIVDGVTGLLVPAGDASALARALGRYLGDPGLRRTHGVAGRQRALRDFRPSDLWQELYQEYDRLLAGRSPARGRRKGPQGR